MEAGKTTCAAYFGRIQLLGNAVVGISKWKFTSTWALCDVFSSYNSSTFSERQNTVKIRTVGNSYFSTFYAYVYFVTASIVIISNNNIYYYRLSRQRWVFCQQKKMFDKLVFSK